MQNGSAQHITAHARCWVAWRSVASCDSIYAAYAMVCQIVLGPCYCRACIMPVAQVLDRLSSPLPPLQPLALVS
jgi:hypothetical protein